MESDGLRREVRACRVSKMEFQWGPPAPWGGTLEGVGWRERMVVEEWGAWNESNCEGMQLSVKSVSMAKVMRGRPAQEQRKPRNLERKGVKIITCIWKLPRIPTELVGESGTPWEWKLLRNRGRGWTGSREHSWLFDCNMEEQLVERSKLWDLKLGVVDKREGGAGLAAASEGWRDRRHGPPQAQGTREQVATWGECQRRPVSIRVGGWRGGRWPPVSARRWGQSMGLEMAVCRLSGNWTVVTAWGSEFPRGPRARCVVK